MIGLPMISMTVRPVAEPVSALATLGREPLFRLIAQQDANANRTSIKDRDRLVSFLHFISFSPSLKIMVGIADCTVFPSKNALLVQFLLFE